MCVISSSVFRVLLFPNEGKIVTIDQLSYTQKTRLDALESNVPFNDHSRLVNESLGVEMYKSLMGFFDMPAPIN